MHKSSFGRFCSETQGSFHDLANRVIQALGCYSSARSVIANLFSVENYLLVKAQCNLACLTMRFQ
jgi:hypothetical protein